MSDSVLYISLVPLHNSFPTPHTFSLSPQSGSKIIIGRRVGPENASPSSAATPGSATSQTPPTLITFDSRVLSRQHATLERLADGGVGLRDMGSSNGTFVNGVQIPASPKDATPPALTRLVSGDILAFGIDMMGENGRVIYARVQAKLFIEQGILSPAAVESTSSADVAKGQQQTDILVKLEQEIAQAEADETALTSLSESFSSIRDGLTARVQELQTALKQAEALSATRLTELQELSQNVSKLKQELQVLKSEGAQSAASIVSLKSKLADLQTPSSPSKEGPKKTSRESSLESLYSAKDTSLSHCPLVSSVRSSNWLGRFQTVFDLTLAHGSWTIMGNGLALCAACGLTAFLALRYRAFSGPGSGAAGLASLAKMVSKP